LNALFNGRHCIVNSEAVEGTGLESICHLADGSETMRSLISELYTRPMPGDEIRERQKVLTCLYNRQENVDRLVASIW
jgi:hypothetical protein